MSHRSHETATNRRKGSRTAMPTFLQHWLIRRKAGFESVELGHFTVRPARTVREHKAAFRLLHAAYVYEGIEKIRTHELRMTPHHVLSEATVLIALEGSRVVGTISVTLDSPAGLPLDKDCSNQLGHLRNGGARLAEIGSLAVVHSMQSRGVLPLLSLAAMRLAFGRLGCTHTIIGINPRAVPYYRAVWDYSPMTESLEHSELTAPLISLVAERESTFDHLGRHFRRPMHSGKTLAQHLAGASHPDVELPDDVTWAALPQWKLSRATFRELFVENSDHLAALEPSVSAYLREQRSRKTLVGIRPVFLAQASS